MQNKSDFKILAIDDDKDILLLLRYNLESEGYHVETASSGKKGISIAQKSDPDLILIDIMMPEMDGIQTCIKLREIDNLKSSHILFLTARALGSCRALCDKKNGIVSILGTGSNSCYYDGDNINMQINSLGYLLGDEGS